MERADDRSHDLSWTTNTELLTRLRDSRDDRAWSEWVRRFRPLLVAHARRVGLAEDDADEVAQATLVAFHEAYTGGRYDRDKGRLRAWLFGIAVHQLAAWRRTRARRREEAATDGLALDDRDHLEAAWEREWRDALLRQGLELVRREVEERTFQVFEALADGEAVRAVAERFGLTENAVYGAKRRVLRRLRELLPLLEETW